MLRRPRILPFVDWDEWILVKRRLYNCYQALSGETVCFGRYRIVLAMFEKCKPFNNVDEQKNAEYLQVQAVISMWQCRGKVPHAVYSTAQVLAALYRDWSRRFSNSVS